MDWNSAVKAMELMVKKCNLKQLKAIQKAVEKELEKRQK